MNLIPEHLIEYIAWSSYLKNNKLTRDEIMHYVNYLEKEDLWGILSRYEDNEITPELVIELTKLIPQSSINKILIGRNWLDEKMPKELKLFFNLNNTKTPNDVVVRLVLVQKEKISFKIDRNEGKQFMLIEEKDPKNPSGGTYHIGILDSIFVLKEGTCNFLAKIDLFHNKAAENIFSYLKDINTFRSPSQSEIEKASIMISDLLKERFGKTNEEIDEYFDYQLIRQSKEYYNYFNGKLEEYSKKYPKNK
jgi:hypothetical protein